MKLLYIADGRSPIALSWMSHFIQVGHEVHLVSTFHCEAIAGLASMVVIPVALSGFYRHDDRQSMLTSHFLRRILPVKLRTRIRQLSAPMSLAHVSGTLQEEIRRLQPDLIHAMRIPYEGMLAADAIEKMRDQADNKPDYPLLISVWGNDFTLHARSTPAMMTYTQKALNVATALHTDCQRDQHLANDLGFDAGKPRIMLPGGGGIRLDIFYPPDVEQAATNGLAPVTVINPRGIRAYVRNDTFFQAIPGVVEKYPQVQFICPDMQGEGQAEGWVSELGIEEKVKLMPAQTRQQMAELFRQSQITLSITTHDGTPNTLLEAMACGNFPIAGDIESLREWITPGVNGLLVDPGDAEALAGAILQAIEQPELRRRAREKNLELVEQRAEYGKCMGMAEEFYQRVSSA